MRIQETIYNQRISIIKLIKPIIKPNPPKLENNNNKEKIKSITPNTITTGVGMF